MSVVVACHQADSASLRPCLDSLTAQTDSSGEIAIEIIVVSHEGVSLSESLAEYPPVKAITAGATVLTPVLWQIGINAAGPDAEIVALTIAACVPSPNWIAAIRAAFTAYPDLAGVGGALDAPHNGTAKDWAIYFARYSAFMPPVENRVVDDVAGDNAAYRMSAIQACAESWRDGFWETLVHDCLQVNHQFLRLDSAMTVQLAAGGSLREMAKMRFDHGRHYGRTRSGNRIVRVVTSPAIPFVLLNRIFGRVRAKRPDWIKQFTAALPALIVLIMAWSLGELIGYIAGVAGVAGGDTA